MIENTGHCGIGEESKPQTNTTKGRLSNFWVIRENFKLEKFVKNTLTFCLGSRRIVSQRFAVEEHNFDLSLR